MFAPTFLNCGKKIQKLGDIKVSDMDDYGYSVFMLLSGSATTAKITEEMVGAEAFVAFGNKTSASFCYASEDYVDDPSQVGWYLAVDEDKLYPMNNVEIDVGRGFLIDVQDEVPTFTSAGEVNAGDEDGEVVIPVNAFVYNLIGNITPRARTLGDMVVSQMDDYGYSVFMLMSGSATTAKITEEMVGAEAFVAFGNKTSASFCYASEDYVDDPSQVGWYLAVDEDKLYPMNSVPFDASKCFLVDVQDSEPIISIPSALKSAAK